MGTAREQLPAPAFLPQSLDDGNIGKRRKLRAGVDTPSFQGFDQLNRHRQRGGRKGSQSDTLVAFRNHRDAGKSSGRTNRSFRIPGDSHARIESHIPGHTPQVVCDFLGRAKEPLTTGDIENDGIEPFSIVAFTDGLDTRRNRPRTIEKRRMCAYFCCWRPPPPHHTRTHFRLRFRHADFHSRSLRSTVR